VVCAGSVCAVTLTASGGGNIERDTDLREIKNPTH